MLSPRFDASAPLATQMWAAVERGSVDGVIALDPIALQAILAATGPIQVGTLTVNADNVIGELLHGQYLRYPDYAQALTDALTILRGTALFASPEYPVFTRLAELGGL